MLLAGCSKEFFVQPLPESQRGTLQLLQLTVGFVVAMGQLSFALKSQAIVASPHPVELSQADGRKITLRIRVDEHLNWHEDSGSSLALASDPSGSANSAPAAA